MTSSATAPPSPWVTDVVLALASTLVVAVVIAADPAGDGDAGPAAYAFAAGLGALVLLRRFAPRTMLVLTFLGVCAYYALGLAPVGMVLPAVAALYSAAERGRTGWAVATGGVLVVVATYFRVTDEDVEPAAALTAYDLVTNVALTAAAVALGVAVRLAREARERTALVRELTAEQEAHAAQERLQAERLRIARDLHDTVGHHLSVVALHAGVADEAVGRDDDAARGALARVREAASGTLDELRATVKVLREPAPDAAPRGALGLAGLDGLVAPVRAAGVDVEVVDAVAPGALSDAIDAAAYRIAQEALTNVLRHARARHVRVEARVDDGHLRLAVTDDGRGSGAAPGTGAGLAGMRERAGLLGGTLTAGDAPGGGFAVVADLPATLPR
ncbi:MULTISPECIES: sensor histidine kinase [unclassified Isoptericola]|uniref:sensor histidine kinase n=1 Tax=unclassified Isoptericola TaxID=2623355 RepID=UPI003667D865